MGYLIIIGVGGRFLGQALRKLTSPTGTSTRRGMTAIIAAALHRANPALPYMAAALWRAGSAKGSHAGLSPTFQLGDRRLGDALRRLLPGRFDAGFREGRRGRSRNPPARSP